MSGKALAAGDFRLAPCRSLVLVNRNGKEPIYFELRVQVIELKHYHELQHSLRACLAFHDNDAALFLVRLEFA